MATLVACPVCRNKVQWSEANRWRPFCSERCKLIDLGDWAAERHVIVGSPIETADEVPAEGLSKSSQH